MDLNNCKDDILEKSKFYSLLFAFLLTFVFGVTCR